MISIVTLVKIKLLIVNEFSVAQFKQQSTYADIEIIQLSARIIRIEFLDNSHKTKSRDVT